MSGIATLIIVLVLFAGAGLWRGIDAIRRFPQDTVTAMQPVLERIYKHKAATGQWPAALSDVGMDKVVMPRLATSSYEIVDEATAQIRVHGPGHQFLSFMLFENENLRKESWTLRGEGAEGEILCPTRPW